MASFVKEQEETACAGGLLLVSRAQRAGALREARIVEDELHGVKNRENADIP